jgi:hypothetical protein
MALFVKSMRAKAEEGCKMSQNMKTEELGVTWDGLVDEHGPIPCFPRRKFDERGRLISISPEERKARSDAALRALAAIDTMVDDDPPGIEAEFMRGIDDNRPPGQKVFEGWGLS